MGWTEHSPKVPNIKTEIKVWNSVDSLFPELRIFGFFETKAETKALFENVQKLVFNLYR